MRIEPFADGACHVGDHLGQAIGIAILASGGRFEERTDATSLKLLMSSRSCQSTAMQAARQSTYGARLVEGNHIKTPWHNDPDPHAPKRRDVVYLRRGPCFCRTETLPLPKHACNRLVANHLTTSQPPAVGKVPASRSSARQNAAQPARLALSTGL